MKLLFICITLFFMTSTEAYVDTGKPVSFYKLLAQVDKYYGSVITLHGIVVISNDAYPRKGSQVYLFPNEVSAKYFILEDAVELYLTDFNEVPADKLKELKSHYNHKMVEVFGEFTEDNRNIPPSSVGVLKKVHNLKILKAYKYSDKM